MLEEERELTLEAKTKSSQAFGQVTISVMLVPFFGLVLYGLLPGIDQRSGAFLSLVCCCILLGILAFFWMLLMMESARFGQVSRIRRGWILSSKIFFERMVADISCGHPPDLAWSKALEFLERRDSNSFNFGGVQIWERDSSAKKMLLNNVVEESIVQFGLEIRRRSSNRLQKDGAHWIAWIRFTKITFSTSK